MGITKNPSIDAAVLLLLEEKAGYTKAAKWPKIRCLNHGTGVAPSQIEMKEETVMDSLLKKKVSKGVTTVGVAAALALVTPSAYVQAAASKTLSVSQQEMNLAEKGWSAKKDIQGKAVYNDNNEKIGDVNDVIFSRTNSQVRPSANGPTGSPFS